MKGNIYGSATSASMDPKSFMVQALKKILLNNGNIAKFYNSEQPEEIKEKLIRLRLANSEALIEEMKKHLNIDQENEAIIGVMRQFEWLLKEGSEIEEFVLGRKELDQPLGEKIKSSDYIVKNLLEGFSGLKEDLEEEKQEQNGNAGGDY